jgi:hypothetical protein
LPIIKRPFRKPICCTVYFSGERPVKFRDNAEPEFPQPAVPTLNIQKMNVRNYAHHIVAVSDEFQSHRSQKKTGQNSYLDVAFGGLRQCAATTTPEPMSRKRSHRHGSGWLLHLTCLLAFRQVSSIAPRRDRQTLFPAGVVPTGLQAIQWVS